MYCCSGLAHFALASVMLTGRYPPSTRNPAQNSYQIPKQNQKMMVCSGVLCSNRLNMAHENGGVCQGEERTSPVATIQD